MNNKCNNCAKFLTCNRKSCNKITFVEAGILEKPQILENKNINNAFEDFGIKCIEAAQNLQLAMAKK